MKETKLHRRNPHRLAALLDREVSSEPSANGEFAIHHRKNPAQEEQRAELGSLDIGSEGRWRLWKHQAEVSQAQTWFGDGGIISARHGPPHPLGCFRTL